MSYELHVAVGAFDLLRRIVPEEVRASVVPLRHRMGFVPLLTRLPPGGGRMPPEDELSAWSRAGTLGHMEADFHGGTGEQTASLWRDGRRVWGPVHTSAFPEPRHEWPINAVLARLGVVLPPGGGRPAYHDLFVEVGLGVERDAEGWSRHAVDARRFSTYAEWDAVRQAEREVAARAAASRDTYTRLPDVPVPLDGGEVMRILGIGPGRQVGAAVRFLQNLRAENAELTRDEAITALRSWHDGNTDDT